MKETTEISEGKMFSPGNLRATFDNPDYDKVLKLSYCIRQEILKLFYSLQPVFSIIFHVSLYMHAYNTTSKFNGESPNLSKKITIYGGHKIKQKESVFLNLLT